MAKKPSPPSSARADRPGRSFTDTARVKELIALMTENGLTEIELAEDGGGNRIMLRRGAVPSGHAGGAVAHSHPMPQVHLPAHGGSSPFTPPGPPDAPKLDDNAVTIKSPMVGTFYAAPNPESDPYVSLGSDVEKDKTVVCVIEAMKVFNEIHADATGTITKIFVANGQTVEFGQPLFLVKLG